MGRAGGERGKRITGSGFVDRLPAEVHEAVRVGVLERVNERGLPAGEKRRG